MVHFIYGVLIILLVHYNIINSLILLLAGFTGLIFAGFYKRKKIPLLKNILDILGREGENVLFPLKGLIFFTFGCSLTLGLFARDIAFASIIILSLGDSISRIAGPYGKKKYFLNKKKNMEGILAGILFAAAGGFLFVPLVESVTAAVFAMLVEGMDLKIKQKKIDDNLTIPLLAGLVIWIKRILL